jgi:ABC-type bacteriocin/lantibiotic exporters, contain an N-terminal double-glycine peptidase domain
VILDEATSVPDMATEAKLLDALRSLAVKLTMVVAAQRLSTGTGCHQLIDLRNEACTLEGVSRSKGLRQRLVFRS